jgi:hypothetical protein
MRRQPGSTRSWGKLPGEVKREHTWRTRADFLDRINRINENQVNPVNPVKKWCGRFTDSTTYLSVSMPYGRQKKEADGIKPSASNSKH